jgi:hypothetical protein
MVQHWYTPINPQDAITTLVMALTVTLKARISG